MIVCPNCNHPNPQGAQACEACYTPLPATTNCPSCGALVQTDASFCGQCGFSLRAKSKGEEVTIATSSQSRSLDSGTPNPLMQPEPLTAKTQATFGNSSQSGETTSAGVAQMSVPNQPSTLEEASSIPTPQQSPFQTGESSKTQLQLQQAGLLHVQTDTVFELQQNLSVIHIGKPNDRIPPDIDVSGFPHSEIVSRIHADIRVEGDSYFVEDVGSSNGTYINNLPLLPGNRHRLRPGDRISLGKGDLVTFLFQIS